MLSGQEAGGSSSGGNRQALASLKERLRARLRRADGSPWNMHGRVARISATVVRPQLLSTSRATDRGIFAKPQEASLEKLSGAIDHEAETSQHYIAFWTTMQEFVSRTGRD